MSNPAIVLMTDPSRCGLGDVHYLLQALREMQHMGPHATSQAFCDHPAAAEGFIAAYAHAYPQLVLQDAALPTPDHLQTLIASGRIGALGQPPGLAPVEGQTGFNGALRPADQGGSSSFPIVVLTLGTSQVLIDAMQQTPAMRSIRLIDILPEGMDSPPVSIAEAVGGPDPDGGWEAGELDARPELDEVERASTTRSGGLELDDDPMGLDRVETAAAPTGDAPGREDDSGQEPVTAPQPVAAEQPESAVAAEPALETAAPEASPTAEPVAEAPVAEVNTAWPGEITLTDPAVPGGGADALSGQGSDDGAERDGEPGDSDKDIDQDADDEDPADEHPAEEEPDLAALAERGMLDGDDVHYPPVGSLISGADVLYAALDQAGVQGMLREFASAMLDDAIFDPDQATDDAGERADDLPPGVEHEDAPIRSNGHAVTIEDVYGAFDAIDAESEDAFADPGAARPSHDTDL